MCLLTKEVRSRVAKCDRDCYKVVKVEDDGSFTSPYVDTPYRIGETKKENLFPKTTDKEVVTMPVGQPFFVVEKGLHTFADIEGARLYANSFGSKTEIVKCHIPKGASYFHGIFRYHSAKTHCNAAARSYCSSELHVDETVG